MGRPCLLLVQQGESCEAVLAVVEDGVALAAPRPPDCLGVQPLPQGGDEPLVQGTGPAVAVAVAVVGVEDGLDPAGGSVLDGARRLNCQLACRVVAAPYRP